MTENEEQKFNEQMKTYQKELFRRTGMSLSSDEDHPWGDLKPNEIPLKITGFSKDEKRLVRYKFNTDNFLRHLESSPDTDDAFALEMNNFLSFAEGIAELAEDEDCRGKFEDSFDTMSELYKKHEANKRVYNSPESVGELFMEKYRREADKLPSGAGLEERKSAVEKAAAAAADFENGDTKAIASTLGRWLNSCPNTMLLTREQELMLDPMPRRVFNWMGKDSEGGDEPEIKNWNDIEEFRRLLGDGGIDITRDQTYEMLRMLHWNEVAVYSDAEKGGLCIVDASEDFTGEAQKAETYDVIGEALDAFYKAVEYGAEIADEVEDTLRPLFDLYGWKKFEKEFTSLPFDGDRTLENLKALGIPAVKDFESKRYLLRFSAEYDAASKEWIGADGKTIPEEKVSKKCLEELESFKKTAAGIDLHRELAEMERNAGKDIATNFVLEKLAKAGIEVVTDKAEFDKILANTERLQKMTEEYNELKKLQDKVDEQNKKQEELEKQIALLEQKNNGLVLSLSEKNKGKNADTIAEDFSSLDKSLRFNANFEIPSEKLGDEVSVFPGSTGKNGMGIRHLIEERANKDNLSQDEITALAALVLDCVRHGDISRNSENRCEITKGGIIAIVRKDFDDEKKNWILTGFAYNKEDDSDKKREATEAIQTVIAKYSQSPDYSYFRSQVGAVMTSLNSNISQSGELSSGKIQFMKTSDANSNPNELFATHNNEKLDDEINSVKETEINDNDTFINISEKTPFIYQHCGLENFPVNMYRQKLARALYLEERKPYERITHGHKNEFTQTEVKKVFKELGNPRYIFNSKSNYNNPADLYLVGVYDTFDKQSNPMVLSMHYNKNRKEIEANWVTALYGKRINTLVDDWTKKGLLVYMNDLEIEKAPAEVVTLQVRVSKSASAYENNIIKKSQIVNDFGVKFNQMGETVYGFTHNNKIYLNPDVMDSEAAVHEYTHLWDAYTQRTNPKLWEKGKDILSKTYLWGEVKNDPNYADIADDDNLVLSECHARVCGKIASQVLERIASKGGEIAKDAVIDWDKEVFDYVRDELVYSKEKSLYENQFKSTNEMNSLMSDLTSFMLRPMRDLMNERRMTMENTTGKQRQEADGPLSEKVLDELSASPREIKDRVTEFLTDQLYNDPDAAENYTNMLLESGTITQSDVDGWNSARDWKEFRKVLKDMVEGWPADVTKHNLELYTDIRNDMYKWEDLFDSEEDKMRHEIVEVLGEELAGKFIEGFEKKYGPLSPESAPAQFMKENNRGEWTPSQYAAFDEQMKVYQNELLRRTGLSLSPDEDYPWGDLKKNEMAIKITGYDNAMDKAMRYKLNMDSLLDSYMAAPDADAVFAKEMNAFLSDAIAISEKEADPDKARMFERARATMDRLYENHELNKRVHNNPESIGELFMENHRRQMSKPFTGEKHEQLENAIHEATLATLDFENGHVPTLAVDLTSWLSQREHSKLLTREQELMLDPAPGYIFRRNERKETGGFEPESEDTEEIENFRALMNGAMDADDPEITHEQASAILKVLEWNEIVVYADNDKGGLCIADASEDFTGEADIAGAYDVIGEAMDSLNKAMDYNAGFTENAQKTLEPLFEIYRQHEETRKNERSEWTASLYSDFTENQQSALAATLEKTAEEYGSSVLREQAEYLKNPENTETAGTLLNDIEKARNESLELSQLKLPRLAEKILADSGFKQIEYDRYNGRSYKMPLPAAARLWERGIKETQAATNGAKTNIATSIIIASLFEEGLLDRKSLAKLDSLPKNSGWDFMFGYATSDLRRIAEKTRMEISKNPKLSKADAYALEFAKTCIGDHFYTTVKPRAGWSDTHDQKISEQQLSGLAQRALDGEFKSLAELRKGFEEQWFAHACGEKDFKQVEQLFAYSDYMNDTTAESLGKMGAVLRAEGGSDFAKKTEALLAEKTAKFDDEKTAAEKQAAVLDSFAQRLKSEISGDKGADIMKKTAKIMESMSAGEKISLSEALKKKGAVDPVSTVKTLSALLDNGHKQTRRPKSPDRDGIGM